MAAKTGRNAKIEWAGKHVRLGAWTLDAPTDMHDVTEFSTGTTQWREFVPGLTQWSGTLSGAWRVSDSTAQEDLQSAALAGTTGTIKLYIDKSAGDNLTGAVYINSLGVSANIDNRTDMTFSFQGTGALTYSTAT